MHISTQLNVSNIQALKFYARFADVIVLARELNLHQVKEIYNTIISENICGPSGELVRIEMFAHGALCMAISGKCYLSLNTYGASANRGACYQLCRRGYEVTDIETGNSGVKVFKIEGRARSAEYVKRCTSCYRKAANAVCDGTYNPELAAELKEKLSEVFNRGFWDGYYQGALLGQWSSVYGSSATRKKVYSAKVTNWFDKINVAELAVESAPLHVGDEVIAIGNATGVVEFEIEDMRVNLRPAEVAEKGVRCSVAIAPSLGRLRRGDKIYLWQN